MSATTDDFTTINISNNNAHNSHHHHPPNAATANANSSGVVVTQNYSPKRPSRCMPNTVPPQPVSDRTLLDSVTGFINDVTQANSGASGPDASEAILWTRFETFADPCDPTIGDDWDVEGGVAPPLLLVLGYGSGVQCWIIPANGEAVEVLSWRHGSVRTLRLLPQPAAETTTTTPNPHSSGATNLSSSPPTTLQQQCCNGTDPNADAAAVDRFAAQRPLIAICDANAVASTVPFCGVNFVSLRSGELVRSIKFKTAVLDIVANRSAVVVSFADRLAVFDAGTLEDRMTVTTCHPGIR